MEGYFCQTEGVSGLDFRRWFDPMASQTLQIATWLLYFDGFFGLVSVLDRTGHLGFIGRQFPPVGFALSLAGVAVYPLAGLLMANERRLGYQLAIVAAASPFVLRSLATVLIAGRASYGAPLGPLDYLLGRPFLGGAFALIFDVALAALVLHPQSRAHQNFWYR